MKPIAGHRIATAMVCLCAWSWVPIVQAQGIDELKVVLRPATVFVGEGDDAPKGFDVDLLDMFVHWHGRKSGRDITYEATSVKMVPELLEKVRERACDLAIGSITITEERDRTVDFSIPYLPLRSVVFAAPGRIHQGGLETVLEGKTVGAVAGTTHEALGRELIGKVPGLELDASFDTQASLFAAVTDSSGKVQAGITDITHFWIMSQLEKIVLVDNIGPPAGLGFVLPEGSSLKPVVDEFLREIQSTPTYIDLIERYFGSEAAKMIRYSRDTAEP